jgi:dTDP-4-dehydrorhamnose reductase
MKWLITGARGQLGTDLQAVLSGIDGSDILATNSAALPITDAHAVNAAVDNFKPDVIINAAAYTAVDKAEEDEQAAYELNAVGPANLAMAAGRVNAKLLHVSTDYVFAGDATTPYEVDSPTDPRSVYGRTKLAGELAVRELLPDAGYVVRTAWVYGAAPDRGNFVKTMARLEKSRDTPTVVGDQHGSPTWSFDLARGLAELAQSNAGAGTYHCTNSGETTWFGFAQAIFEELGADPNRVHAITTAEYPTPAARPAYSVLSSRAWLAAGLTPMPDWREALHNAFAVAGDAFTAG